MALSRRTGRSRFTLLVLVLTSVTVITLDFRGSGFVDGARDTALDVFAPVKSAADTVFEPVGDAWDGIFDYGDVESENERLRQQLAELQGDEVRGADAERQLEDLLAEQDIEYTPGIDRTVARVVSGPVSNFGDTIELGKGRDAGIAEGMPVVTEAGLVGTVVQVSSGRSVVRLLTDPDFTVGVRLVTSQDVGVAEGRGEGHPLVITAGIDPRTPIPEDERVTTSGLDRSLFPPSVPVGRVVAVTGEPADLQQEVEIVPLAELDRLTFVSVLLWEPTS